MANIDSTTYGNCYTSAVEMFLFSRDKPDQLFCYPEDGEHYGHAVNWMGERFSRVPMYRGKVWRDNFGGERQSVSFRGVNGVLYAGTLYGTYIRARRVKD